MSRRRWLAARPRRACGAGRARRRPRPGRGRRDGVQRRDTAPATRATPSARPPGRRARTARLTRSRTVAAARPLAATPALEQALPARHRRGYTLVLTAAARAVHGRGPARAGAADVRAAAGRRYLLSENIIVEAGRDAASWPHPGGLELRLASDADGFVSIVSFGGGLEHRRHPAGAGDASPAGTRAPAARPERRRRPGLHAGDRRAVRDAPYAEFERPRVLERPDRRAVLTGTDRPNTGDRRPRRAVTGRHARGDEAPEVERRNENSPAGSRRRSLSQRLPGHAGPHGRRGPPVYSYVSAAIESTPRSPATPSGCSSPAPTASTSATRRSPRASSTAWCCTGSSPTRSSSGPRPRQRRGRHRAGPGDDRRSCCPQVDRQRNGGNGFTISGLPLADRPHRDRDERRPATATTRSPTAGRPTTATTASRSSAAATSASRPTTWSANDMGVVVRDGANGVDVVGNDVRDSATPGHRAARRRHRAPPCPATSSPAATTGVYLRDSVAEVAATPSTDAANARRHAWSATSAARPLDENTISGVGPSAIETQRGARRRRSTAGATRPPAGTTRRRSWSRSSGSRSPMTLLWIAARAADRVLRRRRGRRARGPRPPVRRQAAGRRHPSPASAADAWRGGRCMTPGLREPYRCAAGLAGAAAGVVVTLLVAVLVWPTTRRTRVRSAWSTVPPSGPRPLAGHRVAGPEPSARPTTPQRRRTTRSRTTRRGRLYPDRRTPPRSPTHRRPGRCPARREPVDLPGSPRPRCPTPALSDALATARARATASSSRTAPTRAASRPPPPGTAEQPIFLCGGAGAVHRRRRHRGGYASTSTAPTYWRLVGFTVTQRAEGRDGRRHGRHPSSRA